tara:strand:- start:818 stop:2113 length:1296 start_codon:yes stop_codon:yes gene_type:complete
MSVVNSVRNINNRILCTFLTLVLLQISGLLTACNSEDTDNLNLPTPLPASDRTELHLRTYDAFWTKLEPNYIFVGSTDFDWKLMPIQTRRQVSSGMTDEEFDGLIDSFIDLFPDDTVIYRNRVERINADLKATLSYEGIGAYISVINEPTPHIVLLSVITSSPAEKAGLRAHDSIYYVDGKPVTEEEGITVVDRIRGPAGSIVTLQVISPNGSERTVEVTRERLQATDMLRYTYLPIAKAGLIRIPMGGNANIMSDMLTSIDTLIEKNGMENLVIDMRVAHSNDDWPLESMLSLFTEGDMGTIYTRYDNYALTVDPQNVSGSQTIPLVLLVGPDTQGASEIFAAALQDKGRATVIGQPTSGYVFDFDHFILPDGGEVFFGNSSYVSPLGRDIGVLGVMPDVLVQSSWDQVSDEDNFKYDSVVTRAKLEFTQ